MFPKNSRLIGDNNTISTDIMEYFGDIQVIPTATQFRTRNRNSHNHFIVCYLNLHNLTYQMDSITWKLKIHTSILTRIFIHKLLLRIHQQYFLQKFSQKFRYSTSLFSEIIPEIVPKILLKNY